MDLLLISRCPPYPLFHGDRLIPFYLARELASRLHQIDLLAYYQQPEDLADVPLYDRMFRSVTLIPEPARGPRDYLLRSARPSLRFPTRAEQSWSPAMWKAIANALEEHPYDVVHLFGGVHVYEFHHLVHRLPNVIVPYESFTLWLNRSIQQERSLARRLIKRLQYRMARSYERWMFERYERVVVLTDKDAQALRDLNRHIPAVTIPNGVDVDYFNPTGYEPHTPTLMFIGNYDYEPNLDAALRLVRDLFPEIRRRVPEARAFVVGGNPPPELMAYASPEIEITGRVPDLRPYFEYSMIFLSPLQLGAGIKNKILESMAMGTPVVATPLSCDGIPVVNEKHVLLGTSDLDLVNGVVRLLQDDELRHSLRYNARKLIEEQFTWSRVADRYDALYRQVIAEHRDRVLSRMN